MQLLLHQQNADALRDLACAALDLLTSNRLELLVERYGYAMSFERNPVEAVRGDLAQALLDASGSAFLPLTPRELPVVFYEENSSRLRAAIDCAVPTQGGRCVLISFVVTGTEAEQFLSLEDISAQQGSD